MTVLKSLDQKANKKFVVKNERIESEHRKFPFRFESDVHEFSDIYDMASGLPEIFEDSRKLAIHGLPVDQPTDRSRKGYNFEDNPATWICLDVDDMPGVDTPQQVISRFPACLHNVTCLFRHSSSSGIRNPDGSFYKPGFRGHFIYVLNEPKPLPELRAWARSIPYVDPALFNKVQPHFFADPEFGDGVELKLGSDRWEVIQGDRDFVLELVQDMEESLEAQEESISIDFETMKAECAFVKHCSTNQMLEPEWYTFLSLVDLETAHEISSKDPRYDPEQTRLKWDQAQTKSKPRTCRNISESFAACRDCKFFNRIKTPVEIPSMEYLCRDYVQVIGTEQFMDLNRRIGYTKTQFDSLHSLVHENRGRTKASVTFEAAPNGRKIDTITYRPGNPIFLEEEGLSAVNIWKPARILPIAGDVDPWMQHVRYLFSSKKDADTFLDWCSFLIKFPDRKVNWSIFLGGGQGIGKGLLVDPIQQILGRDNCRTITPDDLAGGWTHWLKGTKLVLVEEMASFGKRELSNRLKPLITDPPHMLQINEKNQKQFYVPNLTAWIFMSNEPDALIVDKDDRRFFVVWSEAKPRGEDYYTELAQWIEMGGPSYLYDFLLKRNIREFNPGGRAPKTDAKADMVLASLTPLAQYIHEGIEEGHGLFNADLVYSKDVYDHIIHETHLGRNLSNQKLGRALKDAGAEPFKQRLNVEIDGKVHKRNVYSLRNHKQYHNLSSSKIKELIEPKF